MLKRVSIASEPPDESLANVFLIELALLSKRLEPSPGSLEVIVKFLCHLTRSSNLDLLDECQDVLVRVLFLERATPIFAGHCD